MAANLTECNRRLSLLLILSIICLDAVAQKNISGNISQPYAHVSAILTDRVTVDDVTGFAAGDTVLMIQMQGVGIITDPGFYGNYQISFGQPGMHEFLIIQSVSAPTIIFRNDILKPFDIEGNVQIVRVPYYNSAIVTTKLFCDPWNSTTGKGGVIALIAGNSLKLEADIDVSGLGFSGALQVAGEGRCQDAVPVTNGTSYPSTFLNAGIKGEGISIHDRNGALLYPIHAKGQGPNYTGGGGGNGRYSGGGGGSNRGEGGIGGFEDASCPMPQKGGWKGKKLGPELANRIFAGGGGGGAASQSGNTGQGGNGGGIVIIVTDSLISAGGRIVSDGGAGGDGSATGGAGGGGGGGAIALSVSGFKTATTLSAIGGRGGNNSSLFGQGGGGGGGLVYLSKPEATVTSSLNGGNPGSYPSNGGAQAGTAGERKEDFSVQLNGFLFNSIRSSVTGNQTDSICSDTKVALLTGTKPVGGTPPYTYTWQKSYDQSNWIPLVSNSTAVNYNPDVIETTTVYYRRIITDNSLPVMTDISKHVMIIVQPFIKNNTIGSDDIICFAQDPGTIIPTGSLADGNGIFSYKWEVSTDNITWGVPANTNNSEDYTPPPALEVDSWYRRTVNSGRCVNVSAAVSIDVLDNISNNVIINTPAEICFGMSFENLQGSTPATTVVLAGGDANYRFRWESNINSAGWQAATGTNNLANYDPQEQPEALSQNNYIFRRVVLSGAGDVCSAVSNEVSLRDYTRITNNIVTADQVLCSGSTPLQLNGSSPAKGNGAYTFMWQDSSSLHSWTDIAGAAISNYAPPALNETTRYRRVVSSSACVDFSNSIRMTVHKPVLGNSVSILSGTSDTTLCYNLVPFSLMGTQPTGGTEILGDWLYEWLSSSDNITFIPVSAGGTFKDFQPPALNSTTYYRRMATSGTCSTVSSTTVTVNVLPQLSNNTIAADQTICYNTTPVALAGNMPAGGQAGSYIYMWEQSPDGTVWSTAAGTNNNQNYSPPPLTVQRLFRRKVTSGFAGTCVSVSPSLTVSLHPPLPTGIITNIADTSICGGNQVQLKVRLTGTGPWKVTYADNSTDGEVTNAAGGLVLLSSTPSSAVAVNNHVFTLSKIEDANGCLAVSIIGSKRATVYKVPEPNAGLDTAVCGPQVTLRAVPSVGSGIWTFPAAALTSAPLTPVAGVTIDSSLFSGGKLTGRFYWQETHWQCVKKDSVDITFYKRIVNINAGPDEIFYSAFREYELKNDPPAQWETGTWEVEKGTGNFMTGRVTGISEGLNTYKWKITNGLMNGNIMTAGCIRSDLLNIQVYPLEIPEGFSPNNDSEGYNNTFEIKGLNLENNTVEMKIINGAGVEVFSARSLQGGDNWKEWDGKNQKGMDLPEGTYYYVLKIFPVDLSEPQKPAQRSGFIILKRD